MREHDVTALTAAELERRPPRAGGDLALARPGSPVRVPIQARLAAIDTELAGGSRPARLTRLPGCPAPGRSAPGLRKTPRHLATVPGRPFPRPAPVSDGPLT